jgi:PrtD family type I secretion system ABC transporter
MIDPVSTYFSGELGAPLTARRRVLWVVFGMSALLNIMMLSGAMFMLLVYDEALPSRSGPSLVGLVVIVTIAYVFQAALEHLRNRVMTHVSAAFQSEVTERVFSTVIAGELRSAHHRPGVQPVRDLDQLRSFLASPAPMALLDLPWVVLFLGVLFLFHIALGLVALLGAAVLVALTMMTERMTQNDIRTTTRISAERSAFADNCRRNAEAIMALGMARTSRTLWANLSDIHIAANDKVGGTISAMQTISKTFRMFLQSLVLATGAWLVINDQASGGVIIASSILASRALAPIEQAIANWRGFVAARQSWERLSRLLETMPETNVRTTLPPPCKTLAVEALTLTVNENHNVIIRDISMRLAACDTLAIVGASGSGKSSLAKALVGAWAPARGSVRLDGAALDQWDTSDLGAHIGYLPQDIELFDGSIAQNIARFRPDASDDMIFRAATTAGVHDLVLRLPDGYDTIIGPQGRALSAGQTQRIALARALFGDPFLIVLDEPNSNLDADGDVALNQAIRSSADRGSIVIIIAHRPSALSEIGMLLWLSGGKMQEFGPKETVLPRLMGGIRPSQVEASIAPQAVLV